LGKPIREFGIAVENLFNLLGRHAVTGNVVDIFVIPVKPAHSSSIYTFAHISPAVRMKKTNDKASRPNARVIVAEDMT
jgi:hypothetical protein